MAVQTVARVNDAVSWVLVLFSAGSLGYGIWELAERAELQALYWLIAAGLALAAVSDREQSFAAR